MSEQTSTETQTTTEETKTETVDVDALQKEVEKWKHFSRQNEDKYKEASSKLDELQKASMTDAEKAIEDAKAAGRAEAQAAFETERLQLKLAKAAAEAGVPDSVLALVDPNKLVVNGEIQTELLSSLAPAKGPQFTKTASDLGLGAQSSSSAGQWTRDQLARANAAGDYAAINKAREEGKLNDLMSGRIR